ncbi:hypothetical protein DFP72DRAFT_515081 [Ephemerocybe angulata]|uniref:Uncharacterized protein n=1 Tax=Ephemerocybe angulata TaxID=980116 RepID=A0A8H6HQ84_9AGAR|nr:hypothetical protein DFP72DRAFT_515081 [Tulosesus angulatus]
MVTSLANSTPTMPAPQPAPQPFTGFLGSEGAFYADQSSTTDIHFTRGRHATPIISSFDVDPVNYAPSDESLNDMFRSWGIEESDLAAVRATYDRNVDELLPADGAIHILGFKPTPGENVHIIPIPDDRLSLRFFDGGIGDMRVFVFDFVDVREERAVNSPAGYEIESFFNQYHHTGMFFGPIRPLEEGFGTARADIVDGCERFAVAARTPCVLRRPGKVDFRFVAPEFPDRPDNRYAAAHAARW